MPRTELHVGTVPASSDHVAFYREIVAAVKDGGARRPQMTKMEVIATLGKIAGFALSYVDPADQKAAIDLLIANMHVGANELDGMKGPVAGHG
jgi:hypothetical protein